MIPVIVSSLGNAFREKAELYDSGIIRFILDSRWSTLDRELSMSKTITSEIKEEPKLREERLVKTRVRKPKVEDAN